MVRENEQSGFPWHIGQRQVGWRWRSVVVVVVVRGSGEGGCGGDGVGEQFVNVHFHHMVAKQDLHLKTTILVQDGSGSHIASDRAKLRNGGAVGAKWRAMWGSNGAPVGSKCVRCRSNGARAWMPCGGTLIWHHQHHQHHQHHHHHVLASRQYGRARKVSTFSGRLLFSGSRPTFLFRTPPCTGWSSQEGGGP